MWSEPLLLPRDFGSLQQICVFAQLFYVALSCNAGARRPAGRGLAECASVHERSVSDTIVAQQYKDLILVHRQV